VFFEQTGVNRRADGSEQRSAYVHLDIQPMLLFVDRRVGRGTELCFATSQHSSDQLRSR
jgi:hypothetical protein